MENTCPDDRSLDWLIAQRLKALRAERGWSLDELARRCDVSRATLSRLENAEVSPTASVLGKLCAAYGLTMSRLMHLVEDDFAPLIRRDAQAVWTDPTVGFRRRSVSPPARTLAGEAIECELGPGARITYDHPPRPGLEDLAWSRYLDGLRDVGWGGDPTTPRLGYTAAVALRSVAIAWLCATFLADERAHRRLETYLGHPLEEIVTILARLLLFLLDRADEARRLLRAL